ncbi:MAG: tRNA threonylcarbamoyladenosine dehydratase [Tenericutes bacterium]|nr:tRNA threonylcarbamoyladenosine dehydratase [Mycoplasmatota bacterium]MDY5993102.1 tRNA threonylcarbamoyladenosine dehydratase [Bacilli bacterium]
MHKFDRFKKLISEDSFENISSKTVLVVGVGGVGGYVVEALVRSGIGKIIIVDGDMVDETNINRQIIALSSTVGQSKVDVFEKRIKDINEKCEVIKINKFIDASNIDVLFDYEFDYLVDACDTVSTKLALIDRCILEKRKFISSMGTGNKLDPSMLEIVDVRKTVNDPLARIVRKHVKDKRINDKVLVLSSRELPIKTGDRIPGSTSFVPSSAGLLIASYIIRTFINEDK